MTKLATALAVLIAADRGLLDLDEAAGPPGSTVRHLLAHASGLPFEGQTTLAAPGTRRIYSNPGFDALGALVGERAGRPFERSSAIGSWCRSGWATRPWRSGRRRACTAPSATSPRWRRSCSDPTLVGAATAPAATTVAFPGLVGVVPGVGRFDPCDWGLGPELHDGKRRTGWAIGTARRRSGTSAVPGRFLWVDPAVDLALVALTDREFGPWALEAWPPFSDSVLAAAGGSR